MTPDHEQLRYANSICDTLQYIIINTTHQVCGLCNRFGMLNINPMLRRFRNEIKDTALVTQQPIKRNLTTATLSIMLKKSDDIPKKEVCVLASGLL